jgi:hypothetical protein
MTAVFVGVLVLCCGAALGAIVAVGRKRCPHCSRRGLSLDLSSQGGVRNFTCHYCRSEWVSYNGSGMITREAFDAGAREPIPTATARETEP